MRAFKVFDPWARFVCRYQAGQAKGRTGKTWESRTRSNFERFLCTLISAQGGSTVTIVFAIAGYFAIVGICVRFIQFSHQRDQAMRLMTTGWIEQESGALE